MNSFPARVAAVTVAVLVVLLAVFLMLHAFGVGADEPARNCTGRLGFPC